jgi:hypothetical protein
VNLIQFRLFYVTRAFESELTQTRIWLGKWFTLFGPHKFSYFTEVGNMAHWELRRWLLSAPIFINHCFINNYLFCYSVVVHFEIRIVPPEQLYRQVSSQNIPRFPKKSRYSHFHFQAPSFLQEPTCFQNFCSLHNYVIII